MGEKKRGRKTHFFASASLVPCNRTTNGIDSSSSLVALMIPSAMTSHRMIPPTVCQLMYILGRVTGKWGKNNRQGERNRREDIQMLTKIDRTSLDDRSSSNAFLTASAVAPPPTSS